MRGKGQQKPVDEGLFAPKERPAVAGHREETLQAGFVRLDRCRSPG
jgi:hypothetical protein